MNHPFHPLAEIFPLMEGAEFEALVEDIKANGLMNPITLYEDMVLDGRNRFRAATAAGVEPTYDLYEGSDPLAFVVAQNVHRRHLDENQRALVATRLADLPRGRPGKSAYRPISQADAAAMFHVGVRSVGRAKGILDEADPIVIRAVEQGKVSITCAAEIVKLNLDDENLEMLLSPPMPKEDIIRWVEKAKKEAKREETFKRIRQEAEAAPAWPHGKFSVIYADPPTEDDFGHTKKDVERHYPTMSWDDVKSLPVDEIVTDDAVLFLWATPHTIHKSLEVMARWGFEYRTHMVWVKGRPGLGQWVRNRHEILLIGRRGDFPPPPEAVRSSSVVTADAGVHSAKPEEFAALIDVWYPNASKVELFQRGQVRVGWEAWGFEALVEAL